MTDILFDNDHLNDKNNVKDHIYKFQDNGEDNSRDKDDESKK